MTVIPVFITLVLLGNMADDDPEGARIFAELTAARDADTLVLDKGDDVELVNSLQCWADVIVQREVAAKHAASPPVALRTAAWAPWWTFERGSGSTGRRSGPDRRSTPRS